MHVLCSLLILYFQSLRRRKQRLEGQVGSRKMEQRMMKVLPSTSCCARLVPHPRILPAMIQGTSHSILCWNSRTLLCSPEFLSLRQTGHWWFAVGKLYGGPDSKTMVGTLSRLKQDSQEHQAQEEVQRPEKPDVQSPMRVGLQPGMRPGLCAQEDSREVTMQLRRHPKDKTLHSEAVRPPAAWALGKKSLHEASSLRDTEHGQMCCKLQQGGTDLEKHRDLLVAENERLKQELQLLKKRIECEHDQELGVLRQRLNTLEQEEGERKLLISALQREVQQKSERLAEAELRLRDSARERVEEEERLNRRLREYQLTQQPQIKTVEVESSKMKAALCQAQSHSMSLQKQVDMQHHVLKDMQQQLQHEQEEAAQLRVQVELYEMELDQSQAQMVQEIQCLQEEKEQAVSDALKRAQEEMRAVHLSLDGVRKNLLMLQPALHTLTHDYNALKRQVRDFPILLRDAITQAQREFSQAVQSVRDMNAELLHKYQRELQLRKECHNQLVRLRGNIRVLARVRPVTLEDGPGSHSVVAFDQDDDGVLQVTHKGKGLRFEFDKVFTPHAKQEEVFCEVSPLITSCLDGYSVCILAYGQTGSGKTYSMEGIPSDPGINQRALRLLLSEVKERSNAWEHQLSVSMVEIYNESLRDLLSSDPHTSLDIKISPGSTGELYVPGVTRRSVQTMQDINKILDLGHRQRATEHTNVNAHSSRSHALLILTAKGRETCTGICTTGKLYLVDLAGSERVSRSGAAGERLREAQCINRSLSALGDVFSALRSQQAHIPYRNSKLTYLLQEPLSRDGKALLLLQVSPTEKNVNESLCSLRFGDRVRTVELGVPARKIEQVSSPSIEKAESDSSTRNSRNISLRRKPTGSVRQRIGPP